MILLCLFKNENSLLQTSDSKKSSFFQLSKTSEV